MNSGLRQFIVGSIFILFVVPLCSAGAIDSSSLIVQTKQGKLKGTVDKGICVWKGIRYAKAPVGALRFHNPQAPESWTGVKEATAFGAIAVQSKKVLKERQPQSEDCLFLNIWSPAADGKKRPVMFWIHGGGFVSGSGSSGLYNGAQLAKKGDVVIVSINYRLGPLGFLYFKDIPGGKSDFENNLGIKDQVAALKWVKENIAAFGGDPDMVTIFGESAGGISVETLMGTPAAKGLFKRAIAESGPPSDTWTPGLATAITKRYLKELGLPIDSLNKLKTIPADTLAEAMLRLLMVLKTEPSLAKTFAPTIDGDYIKKDLNACIRDGECKGVDLMIGTNRNEANLFAIKRLNMAPSNAIEMKPYFARFDSNAIKHVINAYKDYPHKSGILDLMTDGIFTVPSIRFAEEQSAFAPTYMYRFDWASKPLKAIGLGACHGIEIPFVFGTFKTSLGKKVLLFANKKKIYQLSDKVQQAWINFARTGNPNGTTAGDWKTYSAKERSTQIFDKRSYTAADPESDKRKAWTDLNIFDTGL